MIGLILLAGGKGTRMECDTPKPFLPLDGKPIALHSLDAFPMCDEIVVVCPDEYRYIFPKNVTFAEPGERRQDSVKNGFAKLSSACDTILIHDAARPYIEQKDVEKLLAEGKNCGAALLASPITSTIKCGKNFIDKTLDRDTLWAAQTPQLLSRTILAKGLSLNISVTDDVAFAEAQNLPVKIVPGNPANIKITYPSDLPACVIN